MQSLNWRHMGRVLAALVLAALVAACASVPDPTPAKVTLQASRSVNQGIGGEPSPVVVRLYELKDTGAFNSASFFDFDDDAKLLGPSMVGSSEYEMVPGQNLAIKSEFPADVRYFGVVVAFRDIESARWRDVAELTPGKATRITVQLSNLDVSIQQEPDSLWRLGR